MCLPTKKGQANVARCRFLCPPTMLASINPRQTRRGSRRHACPLFFLCFSVNRSHWENDPKDMPVLCLSLLSFFGLCKRFLTCKNEKRQPTRLPISSGVSYFTYEVGCWFAANPKNQLYEQFFDDFSAICDLHWPVVSAGKGRIE